MFYGLGGIHFILIFVIYGVVLAVVLAGVYATVRLAVAHALKSHTRWIDQGKP